ncbi:hypothetical protein [Subtercola sp. RTI3]|uniref:hypothetical protein n=1 Tax=Subtercola sp. RTI3 TaxID=3048639 RepID=UPI002B2308D6|nr:hypothetical protein [Subtercola sp. RTI3]MEA9984906.1 hypothetical protein [Subtercola sp. RTI3]
MTSAATTSAKLTTLAREQGLNSHETHVLYVLERFLDRLGRTKYSEDFVAGTLKHNPGLNDFALGQERFRHALSEPTTTRIPAAHGRIVGKSHTK